MALLVHLLKSKIAYKPYFRAIRRASGVALGKQTAIKRLQVALDLDPRVCVRLNKIRSQAVCEHVELPRRYARIPIFHHLLPDHLELYKKTLFNITSCMPRFPLGWSTPQLDPTPLELTQQKHRIILPLNPPNTLLNICSEMFHSWLGIGRTAPVFNGKIILLSGLSKEVADGNLQYLLQMYPRGISLGDAEGLSIIKKSKNVTKLERKFRKRGFLTPEAGGLLLKTYRFGIAARMGMLEETPDNFIGNVGDGVMNQQSTVIDDLEAVSPDVFPLIRTVPLGCNVFPDTTPWIERGLDSQASISFYRSRSLYRIREVPRYAVRRIPLEGDIEPARGEYLRQYREQHMIKQSVRRVPLGEDDPVDSIPYHELFGELLVRRIDVGAVIDFTPGGEPNVRGVVDQTSTGLIQYSQPEKPQAFQAHVLSEDIKKILLGEDVNVNTIFYGNLLVRRKDMSNKTLKNLTQDETSANRKGPNFFRAHLAGRDIGKTLLGKASAYASASDRSPEEEAESMFRVPVHVRRPQYVV